nr:sodium/calcium exchanger NCL2-like [Tanacetum cinerariifolium]
MKIRQRKVVNRIRIGQTCCLIIHMGCTDFVVVEMRITGYCMIGMVGLSTMGSVSGSPSLLTVCVAGSILLRRHCFKMRVMAALRRKAWPSRYEMNQGVDSRHGVRFLAFSKMKLYGKNGSFVIFLAILMGFFGIIDATTVTCEPQYGFLPCSTELWGRLFLIVVYQYLMSIESRLTSADASSSAAMGMSVLAGSAVMSLTLIWPSVIVFGSYDLADDDITITPQVPEDETPFQKKLTGYGLTTDIETKKTAILMLVSMIPFLILQLPQFIDSATVTRVIILIALIITLSFFLSYIVYQIFQPYIQNRRFDYVRQKFVSNKLLQLLTTNGKTDARLIKDDGLLDNIMAQLDISGDENIDEEEFIRVVTKWLSEARDSLSKNDYNPLRLFAPRPQAVADEEQQEALLPTTPAVDIASSIWDYLEALAFVFIGIVVAVLVARPLIMNIALFADAAHVPSFFIPYIIIPGAINIPRLFSVINNASQKTQRAASLTLSQIYSGVFMSNMSSLSTFLLAMYIKNALWDVTAEVLVVLIICGIVGVFSSTRTVFPLWSGYVGYVLYPTSLLMLYVLTVVFGWS